MFETNQQFGRYRNESQVGSGGMGEVYLAFDTTLHRPVALKILDQKFADDAERLSRFRQEARAISALNHPNILTVFEIGFEEGLHFIVTEYVEGKNLHELISN